MKNEGVNIYRKGSGLQMEICGPETFSVDISEGYILIDVLYLSFDADDVIAFILNCAFDQVL